MIEDEDIVEETDVIKTIDSIDKEPIVAVTDDVVKNLQEELEAKKQAIIDINNEKIGLGRNVKNLTEKVESLAATISSMATRSLEQQDDDSDDLDEEFITNRDLKKILNSEKENWVKELTAKEEAELNKQLEYNEAYTKKFNELLSDVEDKNGFAQYHDSLFVGKQDPTGNPDYDADLLFNKTKLAITEKALSEGKESPFRIKAHKAPLGVGGGPEIPVKTKSTPSHSLSEQAKRMLRSLGKENDVEFINRALSR